jgi:hypothetical protein
MRACARLTPALFFSVPPFLRVLSASSALQKGNPAENGRKRTEKSAKNRSNHH